MAAGKLRFRVEVEVVTSLKDFSSQTKWMKVSNSLA